MPRPAVVPFPSSSSASGPESASGPAPASGSKPAFILTEATRIVHAPDPQEPRLAETIAIIAEQLRKISRQPLPLAERADLTQPGSGDIEILIDPAVSAPEGYILEIGPTVSIRASTPAGVFYGGQTLLQLLSQAGDRPALDPLVIEDAPRFAYRGMMLDVARHWFPVSTLERVIDHASGLKLNHLHLHLTDDQGWRIEISGWPRLTAEASATSANGDPGGYYSQDDYRRIVAYAAARHITVVPEVDMPGHTHAVGIAYPGIAVDPVISDLVRATATEFDQALPERGEHYTGWAVGFSSLSTREEATYVFVAEVLAELAALTPGPYLHVGGDESHGTGPADYAAFLRRVTALAAATGKTPIAWHEAGSVSDLTPGAVGQYWGYVEPIDGADEKARAFVRNGGSVILSPADAIYLDMKYDASTPLGLTWADGPTSVERAYGWEPTRVIEGLDESAILGVEAPLWTETIKDLPEIETMMFPRIAAAAEIAWSPVSGAERTWTSFRERVAALEALWDAQGIAFHRSPEIPRSPAADGADAAPPAE